MGKCSKTQLKETVNNVNLLPIGYMPVYVNQEAVGSAELATRQIRLNYSSSTPVVLKTVGGDFLDSNGDVIGTDYYDSNHNKVGQTLNRAESGRKAYYFSNTTKMILVPKYDLIGFVKVSDNGLLYCYSEDFIYCKNINDIQVLGEQNVFTLTDVGRLMTQVNLALKFDTITLRGDLSDMKTKTNVTSINLGGISCGQITGDFASWAPYREAGTFKLLVNQASLLQLKCNGVNIYQSLGSASSYDIIFNGQGGVSCAVSA